MKARKRFSAWNSRLKRTSLQQRGQLDLIVAHVASEPGRVGGHAVPVAGAAALGAVDVAVVAAHEREWALEESREGCRTRWKFVGLSLFLLIGRAVIGRIIFNMKLYIVVSISI